MTVDELMLTMGGLTIIASIFGGGLDIKGIKIPRIGTPKRVLAGVAGVIFMLLGLLIWIAEQPSAPTVKPVSQQTGQ